MPVFHADDFVRFIDYNNGDLRVLHHCYGVVLESQEDNGLISVKWFSKDGSTDFTKTPPQKLIHYDDIMMFVAWQIRNGYVNEDDVEFLGADYD